MKGARGDQGLLIDRDPLADIEIVQDRDAIRMSMKDGVPRNGTGEGREGPKSPADRCAR